MATKKKSGNLQNRYKKQHGLHHKQSGKYLKVYWPYIPVFAIVLGGMIYSVLILVSRPTGTIATSSNITVNSLLSSTNKARQSNGAQPLQINNQLSTAAQIKANDMALKNYWSPISPNDITPWQIINSTGYKYQTAGENLAYGFNSAQSVESAWLNSPNHRQNVIDTSYNDVGFGIVNDPDYQGQGPQTIVVALYGSNTATRVTSSSSNQSFNTASISIPASQTVARAEVVAKSNASLTIFVTGIMVGIIGFFLIIRHGIAFRKWALEGEQLIIKHPFLDVTLVILIVGMASLQQTVGIIR